MNFRSFWKTLTVENHPARSCDNFLFWLCSLLYLEILFHAHLLHGFDSSFLYTLGFTIAIALTLSGLLGLLPYNANRIISCVLLGFICLLFCSQVVYKAMFGTLYSIPPVSRNEVSTSTFWQDVDLLTLIFMLLPIPGSVILAVKHRRMFRLTKNIYRPLTLVAAIIIQLTVSQCLYLGGTGVDSAYYFYHNSTTTTQTAQRFGLLTTMRLELFSLQEVVPLPEETAPAQTQSSSDATEASPSVSQPAESNTASTAGEQTPLKIQILGDSMSDNTWGDMQTWVDLVGNYLPEYDLTIVNNAIGGNPLCQLTTGSDTTGIVYQITSGETPLVEDADLIIVWAGSNDWASSLPLGTLCNGDSSTFYGAAQNVIETLREETTAQLLFITPLQRNSEADRLNKTELDMYGNRLNQGCATLEQFAEAIIQTCAHYAVPCLDLYHTSGISQGNIDRYASDSLHVGAEAEDMVAQMVAEAIRNPGTAALSPNVPSYDLSALIDVFRDQLFSAIAVDGSPTFLDRNLDGIKAAFSNGAVTLRYKVTINGTELTVCSTGTATYVEEDDRWTFVSYFEHGNSLIRVTMQFKSYGMEASAVSIG